MKKSFLCLALSLVAFADCAHSLAADPSHEIHGNQYVASFVGKLSFGEMVVPQQAERFFTELIQADSFESMAALYYLTDIGFHPDRVTYLDRDYFSLGHRLLPVDLPLKSVQTAKMAVENWVRHHSYAFDLNIAGAIANAWKSSDRPVGCLANKLFAVYLLSETPIGKWDFSTTTDMKVPSALLMFVRKFNGNVENVWHRPSDQRRDRGDDRLEEIMGHVITAFTKQMKFIPAEVRDGFWADLNEIVGSSTFLKHVDKVIHKKFRLRVKDERKRQEEFVGRLRSMNTAEDVVGSAREGLALLTMLDEINNFFIKPSAELAEQLLRIHSLKI